MVEGPWPVIFGCGVQILETLLLEEDLSLWSSGTDLNFRVARNGDMTIITDTIIIIAVITNISCQSSREWIFQGDHIEQGHLLPTSLSCIAAIFFSKQRLEPRRSFENCCEDMLKP